MANHPSSLVYDADPADPAEYYSQYPDAVYQSPGGLYYYANQGQPSTSSYSSAHDADAVTVVSHQVSTDRACYQSCISISQHYE